MKTNELKEFEDLIRDKIKHLLNKSHDLVVDVDGDEIDAAQSALIIDMAYVNRNRNNEEIERLNDSLEKIKDGSFGLCEECEEEISIKRLKICLDAKLCIRCAEMVEQEAKTHRRKYV